MAARRMAAAVALVAWALWLTAPTVLGDTPSTSPPQGPQQSCQNVDPRAPGGLVSRVTCDVATGGPAGPVQDVQRSAGQAASQAGQAVANATELAFTTWLANGAAWVIQTVLDQVTGPSTTPSLDPGQAVAFTHVYGRVVGVALSLSVLLVLIGIIEATLTQRPGALRRVVVGIAVSGIGLGAVPVATAILVRIVDDLSAYVIGDQTQVVAQGLKTIINILLVLQRTDQQVGAAAFALAALGVMLGGALLWLELVIRESLIYLFLGVVPLACAAVQWPRLEGVLRQVLFAGLALILSKLVIVIALSVGFAVLASGTGLENLLAGMFIIVIAALMPFATARVLPLAAEELSQGHQGRIRGWVMGGVQAGRTVASIATGGAGGTTAAVGLAPAMGSSGPGGTGTGRAGGSPGPGRGPAPGSSGGGSRQVAAAAAAGDAGRSAPRPGAGRPVSRRPSPPPESGPARGPEPPRDSNPPPVT